MSWRRKPTHLRDFVLASKPMAKFFFNIEDGTSIRDDDGTEYPTIAAAQCAAVKYAGALICDHSEKFWNSGEWSMTVSSETGLTLFSLQLIGTESPSIRAMSPSR